MNKTEIKIDKNIKYLGEIITVPLKMEIGL